MLVNREIFPIGRIDPNFKGGLEVFDVSNPSKPTRITTWAARGMHRFTFDGRYVYGSPELDGYLGNIVSIIDFQNPAKPQEVGRWWMPGQWTAGVSLRGKAPRTAAIIRCASATDSTPAIGTAASSSSTSTILPSRSSYRASTGARRSHGRRTRPCRCRFRCAGDKSCWSPTRMSCASPARIAGLSMDGGYHRRDAADPLREFPGGRRRRLTEAGLHRASPVLRGHSQQRNSDRVVRAWAARRRHRKPARASEVASFMPDIPDGAKRVQSNDVASTTGA